jgi:Cell wall-active antibiotics response 4TMS YvqF
MEGRVEESTALAAQRAAIQEARARYERGEIPFEAFHRALDALVLAQDADDCQAILRELPVSPLASLAALETTNLPAPATAAPQPRHKWIVAFMSQAKKMRRRWQLMPGTHALALMGEVNLDLGMAELPPQAKIQITAIMGSVTLYVPLTTRVSVHSAVLLSDVGALGENTSGVVAFGHEEHVPAPGPTAVELEVEVFALMSSVKVVLTDGPRVSVSELVRDALRAAADGVRRGLQQGASQQPALGAGGAGSAESIRLASPADTPPDNARR